MNWVFRLFRRFTSVTSAKGQETPARFAPGDSPPKPIVESYDKYLIDAYDNEDWDGAIVLLARLTKLHPQEEKWRRYLSTAYEKKRAKDEEASRNKTVVMAQPESTGVSMPRQEQGAVRSQSVEKQGHLADQSPEWVSQLLSQETKTPKKTERETKLDLEERLREREAEERAQLFRPRAFTSFEKFKKIKPTGSRDGHG
jgi:hypothetical protein